MKSTAAGCLICPWKSAQIWRRRHENYSLKYTPHPPIQELNKGLAKTPLPGQMGSGRITLFLYIKYRGAEEIEAALCWVAKAGGRAASEAEPLLDEKVVRCQRGGMKVERGNTKSSAIFRSSTPWYSLTSWLQVTKSLGFHVCRCLNPLELVLFYLTWKSCAKLKTASLEAAWEGFIIMSWRISLFLSKHFDFFCFCYMQPDEEF